jgi:hypothetical protein
LDIGFCRTHSGVPSTRKKSDGLSQMVTKPLNYHFTIAAVGTLFTVSSFAVGTMIVPSYRRSCVALLCVAGAGSTVTIRYLQLERAVLNLGANRDAPTPSNSAGTFENYARAETVPGQLPPATTVRITRSVVDAKTLEREAGAYVIRVSCTRTTWREELAAALQEATGEPTLDAAIAHVNRMRSPTHWSRLFMSGVSPRVEVFAAYVVAQLWQIVASVMEVDFIFGINLGDGVAWWLAMRQPVADWIRRGARTLSSRLEHGIAQALVDTHGPVALGIRAAFQSLFLSAVLFDVSSRLRAVPSVFEAAAWCMCTNRPARIVLLIEYHSTAYKWSDTMQLASCVKFLKDSVRITTVVAVDG